MLSSLPETRISLIWRLQDADDVAAWDEFVEIYGPLVYRLGTRRGLQPATADDLVQEVLAAVARSVSGWLERTDRGPFRAWLFRMARNKSIDLLTRRRHRVWGSGGDDGARELELIADPDDASAAFDGEYRREVFRWASARVRDAVAETTWQAFWLTSVEDRPVAEVARRLGCTEGSVYIARSRVMKRLRVLVRQYEELAEP